MFVPCRGEDAQSATVFNIDIGMMYTAVSMELYKAWFMEARNCIYTIMTKLTDPSGPDLFLHGNLPFDVVNDSELEGEHNWPSFKLFPKLLKGKRL